MRFSNIFILVIGVIAVNANAAPDRNVEATQTVGFARATGGVNHSVGSNIVRDVKGAGNVNRRENGNTGKDKVERRVD